MDLGGTCPSPGMGVPELTCGHSTVTDDTQMTPLRACSCAPTQATAGQDRATWAQGHGPQ